MRKLKRRSATIVIVCTMLSGLTASSACAQWIVHDPVSNATRIGEAIKNVAEMVKQYQQMVAEYEQLQQTYRAMTGGRAVGSLFTAMSDMQTYNQLPPEAQQVVGETSQLIGQFSELGRRIAQAERETSRLTTNSFRDMNSPHAMTWKDAVHRIATQRGAGETVYNGSAERTQKLEQLMRAIGSTEDVKASTDMNARIAAEQAMLTNLQIETQALQIVQAAELDRQRQRQSDQIYKAGKGGIPEVIFPEFGKQR